MTRFKKLNLFLIILIVAMAGMIFIRSVFGWGILPMIIGGAPTPTNTSWATWDTTTETAFGDAVNNHVMVMQGTVTGDNEEGVGYTTNPDTVWTQTGNLAGVVAGSRTFDGADDSLGITQTLSNIFTSTNTFTLAMLVEDFAQADEPAFYMRDLAGTNLIAFNRSGITTLTPRVVIGTAIKLNAATADALPATGKYWLFVCCDGTNYFGGFLLSTAGSGAGGQPVKWSEVPAGQKVSAALAIAQFANNAFDSDIYRSIAREGVVYTSLKVSAMVFSRNCLIDFNS